MTGVAQVSRVARVGLRLLDLGGRSVPGNILAQGGIRIWQMSQRILRINDRPVTKVPVRTSSEDVARFVPSGTGSIYSQRAMTRLCHGVTPIARAP